MFKHICFVYPWATLGGVERVLLNRLIVFHEYFPEMVVDVQFFCDAGGLEALKTAISKLDIKVNFLVGFELSVEADYDLVFCIDCPSFFQQCERRGFRYIAECHTTYDDNRKYLKELPESCELLVVPSKLFDEDIRAEFSDDLACDTFVLPNFIPWDAEKNGLAVNAPMWTRQPLVFLGRMDKHKNPVAILEAFAILEAQVPGRFFCFFCGPLSNEVDMRAEAIRLGVQEWLVLLPPIPFMSAGVLLRSLAQRKGIFISPSKAESFGLAAAEALASGMPVVLSDIPSHRFLLGEISDVSTYELGNNVSMCEAISRVADNYQQLSKTAALLREDISASAFAKAWEALYSRVIN